MKKTLLLGCILLVLTSSFAQDRLNLGIKGGLNITNIVNDNNNDLNKYKAGFHVGLLGHIHTGNRKIGIQPEVVYSLQGSEFDAIPSLNAPEQKINLHYLNVPILVQYMFNNGFRLQTGPQGGVLLSAKSKSSLGTEDIGDEYNDFDFSWSFGLGYLASSGLGVDARYNLGISNITDRSFTNNKNRNSVFQLGLFYMFDNHHKAKSR